MTTQLMATAAAASLLTLLIICVVLSIAVTYEQKLEQWQLTATFWASVLAFVFLALYILMSWPRSSTEPDYYYVPVTNETLYRMVRTKPDTIKSLRLQDVDTTVYHMSISDTSSIYNYGNRN